MILWDKCGENGDSMGLSWDYDVGGAPVSELGL